MMSRKRAGGGKSVIFHLLNTMWPLLLIENYSIHLHTVLGKNLLSAQKQPSTKEQFDNEGENAIDTKCLCKKPQRARSV